MSASHTITRPTHGRVISMYTSYMKVLAIDPGYGRCGMAIVSKDGQREQLIFSTCVETSPSSDFTLRLAQVVNECERLLQEYAPQALALEKLFITKNQKTAMRVAEVRGALINAAAQRGIAVFEYTPGQVKNAAAGWGGADKAAVTKMLHVLLKIDKNIKHDDEYDAIAIGLTHLAWSRGASVSS